MAEKKDDFSDWFPGESSSISKGPSVREHQYLTNQALRAHSSPKEHHKKTRQKPKMKEIIISATEVAQYLEQTSGSKDGSVFSELSRRIGITSHHIVQREIANGVEKKGLSSLYQRLQDDPEIVSLSKNPVQLRLSGEEEPDHSPSGVAGIIVGILKFLLRYGESGKRVRTETPVIIPVREYGNTRVSLLVTPDYLDPLTEIAADYKTGRHLPPKRAATYLSFLRFASIASQDSFSRSLPRNRGKDGKPRQGLESRKDLANLNLKKNRNEFIVHPRGSQKSLGLLPDGGEGQRKIITEAILELAKSRKR